MLIKFSFLYLISSGKLDDENSPDVVGLLPDNLNFV